jgi:hypothetical protein
MTLVAAYWKSVLWKIPLIPDHLSQKHYRTNQKYHQFNQFVTYFNPYNSNHYRIAFRYYEHGTIKLTDIIVEAAPSCPSPYNLQVTGITQSDAELSWSNVGTINSWEVKYGHAGFDPETEGMLISNVIENEATLTGLAAGITIRHMCVHMCGDEYQIGQFRFFSQRSAAQFLPHTLKISESFTPHHLHSAGICMLVLVMYIITIMKIPCA